MTLEASSSEAGLDVIQSRRGFLRHIGKTLAIGVGLAAVPAVAASAASRHDVPLAGGSCCYSGSHCLDGTCLYHCTTSCSAEGKASPDITCSVCVSCSFPMPCYQVPCGYCG